MFSGTNTLSPVFENGKFAGQTFTEGDSLTNLAISANAGFKNSVEIEVYDGVNLDINTKAIDMFAQIDDMLTSIQKDLADPTGTLGSKIGDHLSTISTVQNKVLENRADIGARQNRVDMMINRLATQEVVVTKQLSDNEDIDYEKVITEMITQESIHQAALSVGAKIIQSTLVDFIR